MDEGEGVDRVFPAWPGAQSVSILVLSFEWFTKERKKYETELQQLFDRIIIFNRLI